MSKFRQYDKYEVYPDGRIWSYKTKRFLKPGKTKSGYQQVSLSDNEGKIKWYLLHRVVYEAVSGSPIPEGYEINHRNEIKTDNRFFENLELVTHKENMKFGTRNERARKAISKSLTNNPKLSKAVGAFKDGKLVMQFPSTSEAQRNGFYSSAVSRCCNGKLPHYKGYEWRYL